MYGIKWIIRLYNLKNCCIFLKRWYVKWSWKRGYFKGLELVLWNDLNLEGLSFVREFV